MSEHFNQLTPGQAERLACLAEEAGEIVQAVGKILRHGYDSYNPYDPAQTTNRTNLEKEIGDLTDRIHVMVSCGDLQEMSIQKYAQLKSFNAKPFMHHQDEVSS